MAQLKTRLGVADSTDDALLAAILQGVSARIARFAGRTWRGTPCLELTAWDATTPLILSVGYDSTEWLWLPAWPIAAVTDVRESSDGDWDSATALTEATDYVVDYPLGGLWRAAWMRGAGTVRVLCSAGYVAAGVDAAAGQTAMPADLTEAAIEQATLVYQRRAQLGLANASNGSISTNLAGLDLLESVRRVAESYRRMGI